MKKIINIVLGFAFLGLITVSCDVERFPFHQIEQTQAFRTVSDAESLANGMYAQLRNRTYGVYMFTTDVQADQFNASLEFGNRNGEPHKWESFHADDYNIRDIWFGYYSALNNVNTIIENIGNVETETEEEVARMEQILGEAYLIRAFYYHQMVIRWGKPYNAQTAGSDLGVPLVLTYDPTGKPERATVQAVYSQILADIAQAETRLSGGAPRSVHATGDAVMALKARVLLHMGNWAEAAQAAKDLIDTGRYPLINSQIAFMNMWKQDQGSEIIFHLFASVNELPAEGTFNNIYLGYVPSQGVYTPDFIPTQWVVDLYADNDIRKAAYLENLPVRMTNMDYDDIYLFNKYPGNPDLRPGANTNYQHKPIIFRIAESYLIRAEALYRAGDEGGALAALNLLRDARGLDELTGVAGNDLFNEIKEERTRELLGEGFRLNDLMRWNEGVVRGQAQNVNVIETGALFNNLTIEAGHPKFVWGIPQNDMTVNENMVQNPGW